MSMFRTGEDKQGKKYVHPVSPSKQQEYEEPPMEVKKYPSSIPSSVLSPNLKGYTVTFIYSDLTVQEVPILSSSYEDAFEGACVKINNDEDRIHNLEDVEEIHIVDPSIGEILKKIGSSAKEYTKRIAEKGKEFVVQAAKTAGKIPPAVERAAYEYGRVKGAPARFKAEMETQYRRGLEGKPIAVEKPTKEPEIATEKSTEESEDLRWDRKEIIRLIDDTKTSDLAIKASAVAILRKHYPEVYMEITQPSVIVQPS